MLRLLAEGDEAARLGAIHALGGRGGETEIEQLQIVLLDGSEQAAVREAAAQALAGLGGADVVASLGRVLEEATDPALVERALLSLAARPFAESEPQIRALLAAGSLDPDREVAVLEALSESRAGAAPLLFEYASNAARPESRSAAVASLALVEDAEGVPDQLYRLSLREADPGVRGELYQALALHADWEGGAADEGALAERVLAETEPAVRLQGSRMLAARLRGRADPALADRFDRRLLPWIASRAGDSAVSRYDRLLSVDALKLAGTGGARAALEELARGSDAVVAEAAEEALAFPAWE